MADINISKLKLPNDNNTYHYKDTVSGYKSTDATQSEHGLLSTTDKIKLDGIATGAEVNQNAFSNVAIGASTISADSKTDTLTLVGGANITLTPDATNDKITILLDDTVDTGEVIATDIQAGNLIVNGTSRFLNTINGTASNSEKLNGQSLTSTYSSTGTAPITGAAVASAIGTLDGTVSGSPSASKTLTAFSQTDGKVSATFGNISITKSQVSDFPTLGTAAAKNYTTSVTSGSADLVTSGAVWTAIDNLPEPMVFKGSLGTGGTITDLPVNGTAKVGDTYKVIEAGTYASQSAKKGDTFICDSKTASANTWVLIPSGDEPSGTVTSVGISNGGGLSVSGSPITSSGTITISHADTSSQASVNNSGRTYIQDITLDTYGHVTGIASATETVVNTDRYVNSAAFAHDSTNDNVKMTLTRAGSDTATVTANIPKVSSSSAGVAPKGATVSSQSQTTKFLREDGTWAVPSYTTNTNTTYTIGTSGNNVTLTPSSGSVQSITVPYATTAGALLTGSASGDTHAAAIKAYFDANKSTVPRNKAVSLYSSAYSNGSQYIGYYLSSYDSTPYGGFFVAHYNKPFYVGIQSGTYTEYKLARISSTPTNNQVVIADGTEGILKTSGYTIGKSVPSNAVFTDTTYTIGTSDNNVTLTPSSGNAQSITVPYAAGSSKLVPVIHKKYESNSYYALTATQEDSTWYFMSVKPDDWYKPWKVKFKVHSYCPAYANYESITWSTFTGREQSLSYANFNERYDTAHYYISTVPLKKAGFDAGLGHAFGVSLLYASNYTNSAYYRTFEIDYFECENCTVTILDTPTKLASWTGYNTTNYNGVGNWDAVNRGLRETSDDNDGHYYTRRIYSDIVTGSNKIFPYTIIMQNADGRWESLVTSSSTGTSKARNAHGFRLGQIMLMYANATYNENAVVGSYNTWEFYGGLIDHRYSFNTANDSTNGTTANKPIYIVGTLNASDGLFYLDSTKWWTQTLPSSDDGKLYIYLGDAYDYYRTVYSSNHPIYWYKDGKVQEYSQSANYAVSAGTAASASSVAWGNVTGKPSTFAPSAHDHSQIVTVGDKRSTATTPNDYANKLIFQGLKTQGYIDNPGGTSGYSYLVGLRGWSDSSGGDSHELAFNNNGIYWRHGATTTWGSWTKLFTASDTYSGTLTSSQVTTALGYTPYNSTNPNGYTSNTGTITSVKTTAGAHTTINVTSGAANFNVPTKTSHLTNDSGFVTQDTKNTAGSTDTSSKIFLIGATSQATNPQTYSDDQVYVTSGTLQTNNTYATTSLCANTGNSGTAGGVSLYGTSPASYGIAMRGTGNGGKHGAVQSDWAIYSYMINSGTNRGWIWKNAASGGGNVASIDCVGNAVFNGYVGIGGNTTNTSGVRQVYNETTKSLDFVFVA